jgi:CO/xanthine dehydrogenase FAD-binding subunit
MIDTDFTYARAETAEEAVLAWQAFTGKSSMAAESVRYLGGGTEIVTGARRARSRRPSSISNGCRKPAASSSLTG